jgi:hypothetical protein
MRPGRRRSQPKGARHRDKWAKNQVHSWCRRKRYSLEDTVEIVDCATLECWAVWSLVERRGFYSFAVEPWISCRCLPIRRDARRWTRTKQRIQLGRCLCDRAVGKFRACDLNHDCPQSAKRREAACGRACAMPHGLDWRSVQWRTFLFGPEEDEHQSRSTLQTQRRCAEYTKYRGR